MLALVRLGLLPVGEVVAVPELAMTIGLATTYNTGYSKIFYATYPGISRDSSPTCHQALQLFTREMEVVIRHAYLWQNGIPEESRWMSSTKYEWILLTQESDLGTFLLGKST